MSFIINLPLFTVILGLVAVVLTSFLNGKISKIINIVVEITAIVFGILVTIYTSKNGYVEYQLGHLAAPFCNQIRFGPYEGVLAIMIPLVMLLSLLAGDSHAKRDIVPNKIHSFYTLLDLALVALIAIVYTDDIFTGFVFLEISTLSSVGLTMIKNHGRQIAAALRYMIINLLGSGLFLLGCIFIYGETGYLSMTYIQGKITEIFASNQSVVGLTIAFTLISIGLSVKSGLFPFYFWMGDTYGENTTTASSVLSGLISKGYIILLIKFIYRTFGINNVLQTSLLDVLFILGALGMIFGSITAIRQKVINKMVSYSSAAQIGYVFLGIGLGEVGLVAATFHILTHALCKPLLFSTSNRLIDASGKRKKFANLKGTGYADKIAGIGFTIGSLSMVGCPLLAGFISKYLFVTESIMDMSTTTGKVKAIITIIALVVSTLLNTIYYLRTVMTIFNTNREETFELKRNKYDPMFVISTICFIALIFALGMFPSSIISLIEQGIALLG
ncbi:MAG: proton-conducting transporter membrane subunit [Bacilli bacterium]|nr:proton-conducting transporter membrane subunit [Bacillales bacterium]MDY2575452.1 proton-conducting transporter membrane subunit [Bacilli bacterium]